VLTRLQRYTGESLRLAGFALNLGQQRLSSEFFLQCVKPAKVRPRHVEAMCFEAEPTKVVVVSVLSRCHTASPSSRSLAVMRKR
jgi:hypothetical protein